MNSGPEYVSNAITYEGEVEVCTEMVRYWGCQLLREDGSVYLTRWNPGYGTGENIPYSEAEARADVNNPAKTGAGGWPHKRRLVSRLETTITRTTPWKEEK